MSWWILVLGLIATYIAVALRWGAGRSLALVIPLTWLLPAWLMLPIANGAPNSIVGSGLDIKVTVGAACLILYCVMPGRSFPVNFVPSDFAVASLLLLHVAIDFFHDGFDWMVLGRAYAEWYLPYVAGRLAFQSREDVLKSWPALVAIGIALAMVAMTDALTSTNLYEWLFGQRPVEGFDREASRWGFRRSYGPTMHPIYFGVVQLMLMGWAIYAGVLALHRRTHAFGVFAFIPFLLGIVATGSRGPIIGVVVSALTAAFYFIPQLRWPIAILSCVSFITAAAFREPLIEKLEQWSGENQWHIEIDGETRIQSSVRNRVNMLEVNRIALKRSGLLGFGTLAVSGFPINVPLGEVEVQTLKSARAVDNTYVLIMLRFGYLGAFAFVLSAVLAVAQLYWLGKRHRGDPVDWLCGSLAAVLVAALLVQATVWMPHEVGFPLVWLWGVSGGLLVAHRADKLREET